jgi:hypothetical protein
MLRPSDEKVGRINLLTYNTSVFHLHRSQRNPGRRIEGVALMETSGEQPFPTRMSGALAARLSLTASIAALVSLTVLHVLSPEFDPLWRVVSEYALGNHGWALSLMFLAWAISSWSLAFAVRSQVKTIGGRIGLVFLVAAGAGESMASVFDLRQPAPHNLAAALAIPSLPVAAMLISASLSRTRVWLPAKRALLWAATLTWFSLALMVAAMFSLRSKAGGLRIPIGWPNRLLVVAYCTWAIVVAWLAIRFRGQATATASDAFQ